MWGRQRNKCGRKLYWNDLSKLMRILHRGVRKKVKLNWTAVVPVHGVCVSLCVPRSQPWCSGRAVWQHCSLTCYSLKAQQQVLHLGCFFSTPLKIVILLGKMEAKAAFIAWLRLLASPVVLDGVIRSRLFIKLSCKLRKKLFKCKLLCKPELCF